ncbi:MAG: nucleotide sugar dehydrogenase [Nitrospinae bacterium]|nr:nucleotide sugar dehydrogenase [Nitrospinota bacterium]MDA1109711.1 nucleotide sugar dehydrogenase [Nitrospinota bacterium]
MLIQKIKERSACVGVVGLGYVGLPLVQEFGKAGFMVMGLDIDQKKVDHLSKGESYIRHIPSEGIAKMMQSGRFEATTDFSRASDCDCLLICVPTPLNQNREPDMSYIVKTAQAISPYLRKDQLIVLESTTYPGTTQDVLVPELEKGSGLKANQDFFVAYSPEREDPNNKQFSTATIPKVIGADHPESLEAANILYLSIINKTVPVSGTKAAEASKLMENIFRSVNIALVNELKIIFDKMGIDVWEVIEASSTKPFGFMPFYPGPGLGGHCIPIDPFYLTWKAREFEAPTRFIELAGEINVSMPEYVLQKILWALNNVGKSLKGSRILILGMAYKKNIDDDRESPSFKIMELLEGYGAHVDFNDPYVPVVLGPKREYNQFVGKKSVSLDDLPQYDMTVILTDHSSYDYQDIVERSTIVVDTRNACGKIESDKIIKA